MVCIPNAVDRLAKQIKQIKKKQGLCFFPLGLTKVARGIGANSIEIEPPVAPAGGNGLPKEYIN